MALYHLAKNGVVKGWGRGRGSWDGDYGGILPDEYRGDPKKGGGGKVISALSFFSALSFWR